MRPKRQPVVPAQASVAAKGPGAESGAADGSDRITTKDSPTRSAHPGYSQELGISGADEPPAAVPHAPFSKDKSGDDDRRAGQISGTFEMGTARLFSTHSREK